jgi:PAS domain S-box-containing protein
MSGYTQEDLIGRHFRDLTHPEDRELSGPSVKRLLAGEIPSFTLEKRYLRKDGQPFWAQATTAAIQGPDGKIAFALGIVEDITERKQAEDALRQSHKELRAIYDGMFDGLLIMDLETKRFARANPSICRMLGYSDEELLSLSLMDIHVPDEIPVIQQRLQDRAEGRFHGHATTQLVRKDGSLLWADVSSNPLTYGGHPCIAGFFRDITERKLAEETLRISEEKYRGVAEACPDAIVMSDLNGRVLFASRQTWGLLGLADSDELVGQSVFDSVIENDRKRLAENMFHLVGVGVRRNTEYPALRKDGTTVPAEVSSSVIRDVEGQPKAVMAVIRDITERKQAQEALRQSEERYELAVRGAGVGIWDWDIRTGKLYFSPRWKMLFGYDENEIGDSLEDWARLLHPDERDWILKFQEDFLAGTSPTVTVEYRLRHKDGSYHWIVAHGLVVRDEQGRACRLVGSHGDITDRKQAEEALERERQTLWHMLQASDHERQTISYDIHDGLAQYLAAAGMQLQVFDGLRESNPEAAKKAYDAATQLVSQSYAEARRLVSEVRPPIIDEIGLETAISHLVHEQRRHGGPEIECHSSVQFGRLPAILENALYRIAQEALTNACKHSKSKVVTVTMTQEGQDVRLEVRDWGIGFDPKSVGKEHFGLEGIRQRVRLLGGRLTIESAQGSGTLVQVVVPVVERENEE